MTFSCMKGLFDASAVLRRRSTVVGANLRGPLIQGVGDMQRGTSAAGRLRLGCYQPQGQWPCARSRHDVANARCGGSGSIGSIARQI